MLKTEKELQIYFKYYFFADNWKNYDKFINERILVALLTTHKVVRRRIMHL